MHFEGALEVKAVAKNHLGDQMVCRVRDSDAQAEIDLPLRRKVKVNGRKNLMLLLSGGEKIRARAEGAIIFNTPSDLFSEVVAEFKIG